MFGLEVHLGSRSTVFIVDVQPGISAILYHLIRQNSSLDVIVVSISELVPMTIAARPQAFIALSGGNNLNYLGMMTTLRAMGFNSPWIVVSAALADAGIALTLGASGFVHMCDLEAEMGAAIAVAGAGGTYISSNAYCRMEAPL
jgi:DNA-binding NarL/FixJ family response regulator